MSDNLRQYPPSGALFPKTGGKIDYSGQIDISEEVFEDLVAQYKKNKKAMEENKDNLSEEEIKMELCIGSLISCFPVSSFVMIVSDVIYTAVTFDCKEYLVIFI